MKNSRSFFWGGAMLLAGALQAQPVISEIQDVLIHPLIFTEPQQLEYGPFLFEVSDSGGFFPDQLSVVVASSSRSDIVPISSIVIQGGSRLRDFTISPISPVVPGSSEITFKVSNPAGQFAVESFILTIEEPISIPPIPVSLIPPTLSDLEDLVIDVNHSKMISFRVMDEDTHVLNLKMNVEAVEAQPSDLIFETQFYLGGEMRMLLIVPKTNTVGSSILRLTVSDGTFSTSKSFKVTVGQAVPNLVPPVIEVVNCLEMKEDETQSVPFTIKNPGGLIEDLKIIACSSNQDLLPDRNIKFSGYGGSRTLTLIPAPDANGQVQITLGIKNSLNQTNAAVCSVNILAQDDHPRIDFFPDYIISSNQVTHLGYTVTDQDTDPSSLAVTAVVEWAEPSDLIPTLRLQQEGELRFLSVVPKTNATGRAGLRVTVSDGNSACSQIIQLTVGVKPAWKTDDLDGDGLADLLLQHQDGSLAVWCMDGDSLKGGYSLQACPKEWRLAASGDLDHDGQMDLLFQHVDGTPAVWYMKGRNFRKAEFLTPFIVDPAWQLMAAHHVNNNGRIDLVWQHRDGSIAVWYMGGSVQAFATLTTPSAPDDPNWRVVGAADLNQDYQVDLIFQHRTSHHLAVWFMNETTMTGAAFLNPPLLGTGLWQVVAVADYNGDGKADLVFQNGGSFAIWYMDGINLAEGRLLSTQLKDGGWKGVGPR